jgi:hypothetical protein
MRRSGKSSGRTTGPGGPPFESETDTSNSPPYISNESESRSAGPEDSPPNISNIPGSVSPVDDDFYSYRFWVEFMREMYR